MPLTYQNPWNFSEGGNSLGELLARVPQIRAQQALMQQQMMLEQQKVANEQQYQQGMLGYHQSALAQQAPEVAARTKMLLGEAGKYSQEQERQQKLTDLATMFGKAYRTASGYPSYDSYQGGPTIDNAKQLNLGDLAQSEATIEAMNPHQNLIGNTLRLQAQQQQGPFSVDQLNALITGGHLNNPRAPQMLHGKPGDVFINPSNTSDQITIPGQPYEPASPMERWALERAAAIYKGVSDLNPTIQQVSNGRTNTVPNPQWQSAMGLGDSMTNYLNRGQSPKVNTSSQKVLTATNPKTGQKIQSLDGGKTWSPVK